MIKKRLIKRIGIIFLFLIMIQIIRMYPKNNISYDYNPIINKGVIYLLDNNDYIAQLDIIYSSHNDIDNIKEIINLLTINNNESYKIRNGFYSIIPENTKLLNCSIDNDIAILNFSNEILSIDEKMEEKMIESIVYSITSLNSINAVKIKVENQILKKLPHSNKLLPETINRSIKINKEYNLDSYKNITATTIYYPAKNNDYIYYIPVTKYENTDKEKIEIIIEELKSSTTYNSNLISYIKQETELMNYEITDKSLFLNFTNPILGDINEFSLKEEVTYAINMSIKDNYDKIENVMYTINDNFIQNYFLLLG